MYFLLMPEGERYMYQSFSPPDASKWSDISTFQGPWFMGSDWSLRNISLLGKITVIKTLALPILVQCFTVLPDPLDHIIKSLQNIFCYILNRELNFFANCFSPEGEKYQSFSPPDAFKWSDISFLQY
jgi:hypothetical protein